MTLSFKYLNGLVCAVDSCIVRLFHFANEPDAAFRRVIRAVGIRNATYAFRVPKRYIYGIGLTIQTSANLLVEDAIVALIKYARDLYGAEHSTVLGVGIWKDTSGPDGSGLWCIDVVYDTHSLQYAIEQASHAGEQSIYDSQQGVCVDVERTIRANRYAYADEWYAPNTSLVDPTNDDLLIVEKETGFNSIAHEARLNDSGPTSYDD